jgi:carbon monoxide dehydrogenase subunit G
MTRLHEVIQTDLAVDDAFAFVADFTNASRWDPGVRSSERVGAGPTGVGARYRLGVAMGGRTAPMEYEIVEYRAPERVVLRGSGSGIVAVDTIEFRSTGSGTRIEYTADIRLGGVLRLAQPFLGATFDRIAKAALRGMKRALDEMAARPPARTADA